jgi:ATP-binding cassette subfamily F protein 3
LDLAGSFLFRGDHVHKSISVLSGGERARLCLAALLLSNYNVLVLDEPGNHLDVDTVDALAEALIDYQGTVLFTSHDRHFMKRIATAIIEVRGGGVVNYRGDYDAYLYYVNKEIDDGEREQAAKAAPGKLSLGKPTHGKAKAPSVEDRKDRQKRQREMRKEVAALERSIARLDELRRQLNAQLLQTTDAAEALRLHEEITAIAKELTPIEHRWCELQESVEAEEA